MPRLVWLTDPHLNFVPADRIDRLKYEISLHRPDALLIGGDVGEAPDWARLLENLAGASSVPAYFVLGNHDFYRSSIASVRAEAARLSGRSPHIRWLPRAGVVRLGEETVLVGHDGWGDARTPSYDTSDVILNDYLLIEELRAASGADDLTAEQAAHSGTSLLTPRLKVALHALGDEAADHFRRVLPEACAAARNIFVVTHVPPFREACWHDGRLSDDNWAPHFTCVAAGEALAECMRAHPDHRMTVLCGHTHSAGEARVLPNLTVLTGGARYGSPAVQRTFDVE
jgi:3',5'-cyclic-AMP phosphodiesterase